MRILRSCAVALLAGLVVFGGVTQGNIPASAADDSVRERVATDRAGASATVEDNSEDRDGGTPSALDVEAGGTNTNEPASSADVHATDAGTGEESRGDTATTAPDEKEHAGVQHAEVEDADSDVVQGLGDSQYQNVPAQASESEPSWRRSGER